MFIRTVQLTAPPLRENDDGNKDAEFKVISCKLRERTIITIVAMIYDGAFNLYGMLIRGITY